MERSNRVEGMVWVSAMRAVLLGALVTLSFAARPAVAASGRLHGLVLTVESASGNAVIRHDAVGTMPGMTMTFRLGDAEAKRVRAGDRIEANVDESTDPWTVSHVKVVGSQGVTTPAQAAVPNPIRRVRYVQLGELVPNASFVDQSGRPFTFAQLRGQTVVLAFIYTRCRDARMCPLISSKFHTLQAKFRGQAFHLVEVTLDPVYDRPAVLRAYAAQFDADPARWTMLTGETETVLDFAAQFAVTAFPDQRIGLIHPERTVIIDPAGIVRQAIDETSWQPDEIVAAVRSYSNLSSNPIQRFNLWLSSAAVAVCGNRVAGFSGGLDLLIVLAIFGGFGWLAYRLARRFFAEGT
ncbi:MAG: SCO family protein [Candidatus Baltobacteraceae bacterium]